ncbi:MAG: terminase family protein [Vulcanimicrobiota bacterium]
MSVAELLGLDDKAASRYFHGFTDLDWLALLYEWEFWARPKQRRPDPMPYIWMLQTGRGFGKTRTCAETVRALVEEGTSRRIGILTPTAAVGRDVVVEGGSGILACSPPWFRPSYEPSKRRITWPNGAIATLFSSEDPEVIRGAEIDLLWIEEACALKNPDRSFSNAFFALRSGLNPIALISTTPKRRHVILQLVKRIAASQPGRVVITRGHTTENRSNLADSSLSMMLDTYGDTLLGQQELAGEELEDVDGAFWTESQLHALRVAAAPQLKKIVVGVDPAISDKKRSDENGIVVAGRGVDDELYVMADYSIHGGSLDWGRALYNACFDYKVGHIHVETVRGGNLVRRNIEMIWKTENESRAEAGQETLLIPQITEINSQELDKMGRIELFAGLWEQGKAHHVGDLTPKYPREGFNDDSLESEMCDWSPKESKYSPNRIDALIMATSLLYPERQQLVAPMSARVEANPAGMLPRAKARMRGMS